MSLVIDLLQSLTILYLALDAARLRRCIFALSRTVTQICMLWDERL